MDWSHLVYLLLKKRQKEGWKRQEHEEEDVNIYCVTFKIEDIRTRKRKHYITLCEELALE